MVVVVELPVGERDGASVGIDVGCSDSVGGSTGVGVGAIVGERDGASVATRVVIEVAVVMVTVVVVTTWNATLWHSPFFVE